MMKDELLKNGNYNVIIANWTQSNHPPYAQAVVNARVVAAQLAQLINKLKVGGKLFSIIQYTTHFFLLSRLDKFNNNIQTTE